MGKVKGVVEITLQSLQRFRDRNVIVPWNVDPIRFVGFVHPISVEAERSSSACFEGSRGGASHSAGRCGDGDDAPGDLHDRGG